jgi:hypothetical protein
MVHTAFLYGWDAYPVTVIWLVTADPIVTRELEEAMSIDVFVVRAGDEDRLIEGIRRGVINGSFQLINRIPIEEQYIFVKADRLLAT